MVISFIRISSYRYGGGDTAEAVPPMRGVRYLAVRLVVGVDDLFFDAASWIDGHPLLLGPRPDPGGVATVVTSTAPPSPGATTTDALAPFDWPAVLNVGGERLTKPCHFL